MERTLNMNLNAPTAPEGSSGAINNSANLKPAIDELTKLLSGFQTTLKDFTAAVHKNSQTQTKSERDKVQLEKLSKRAQIAALQGARYTPEYIAGRTVANQASLNRSSAVLERQKKANEYYSQAQNARYRNNNKEADKLERMGDILLTGSKVDKVHKDGAEKFWNRATAVLATGFLTSKANSFININKQMGVQAFNNPMMSGYNMGGQFETMANLQTQKSAMEVNLGVAGIVGGLVGAKTGSTTAALEAAALTEQVSSVFTGSSAAKQAIQNRVLGQAINNRMNLESLRATSMRAYSSAESGMSGHTMKDVEVPFIIAISKATALYNQNSKAMGDLTKNVVNFAQASQMGIGDAMKMAGAAAFLSNNKSFSFDKAKQVFNTYGISDYAGTMANATNMMQLGYDDPNKAVEIAAMMAGQNPGYQAGFMSYNADPMRRAALNAITGGRSDALWNPANPGHALATKNARSKLVEMMNNPSNATLAAQNMGYLATQYGVTAENIMQLPILSTTERKMLTNKIGTTGLQSSYYQVQNQINRGEISSDQYTEKLRNFANSSVHAGQSLDGVAKAGEKLTNAFNNIVNVLSHNSNSNTHSGASESTQTKKY
jgi:hypothetical protein